MDKETHPVEKQDDGSFAVFEERRGERKLLKTFATKAEADAEARERDRQTDASIRAIQTLPRNWRDEDD